MIRPLPSTDLDSSDYPLSLRESCVFPFQFHKLPREKIEEVLEDEVQHLQRRLHRILDEADRSAIILDARAISPPVLQRAVTQFDESSHLLQRYNLIVIMLEYQLEQTCWPEYRKWFRKQLDERTCIGRIACLILQDDCPECDALACWIARTDSVIVTNYEGLREFSAAPIGATRFDDAELDQWLEQLDTTESIERRSLASSAPAAPATTS